MDEYKCDPETIEGMKSFQNEIANTHSKLPIDKAISWFEEEIGELKEGIENNDLDNIKEELGDCLVWCASIANSLDIDLSEVVEPKIIKHLKK